MTALILVAIGLGLYFLGLKMGAASERVRWVQRGNVIDLTGRKPK